MENPNKQICRLCLELILDGDCEVIEESKKEILDTLLIKIDFDVSDNAIVCKKCLGTLQNCFDFKSTCFYVNDYISPFVDGDVKVDIKNVFTMTMTSENVNLDDSQICCLCMSFIEDEAFNYCKSDLNDGHLEDMLRHCLPEVNLNSVNEPLVCKPCLSNIIRYYEFMKGCKEVEQKIKNYIQEVKDQGIASKVILEDVLELKKCGTLSKPLEKQCLDVYNETVCLKNEEAANIKCEEIEIKDELDIGEEVNEVVKSENGNNSGKNRSLKKKKAGKSKTKGKKFCCPKCPYSTNIRFNLKIHMRSHSGNKVRTCILCSFVTDARSSLKAHVTKVHSGPTKAFGCHQCPYETDYKHLLKNHLLKHKDKWQVEMQKCSLCPFKTKYKSVLRNHWKMLHGKNINMYKCKECSFSTKYKVSLVNHQLLHKNPEEIPKHECEKCEFQTSYKMNLVKHMLTHENLETVRKFKCEEYPYWEEQQGEVLNHVMVHSNKQPFSCDQCNYSSKYKGHLQRHKLVHQKDDVRQMCKCKLCDYQAKTNKSIKDHMTKVHMDPSKVPTFKCALCPYETTLKRYLPLHITRHHSHKDQPTFKCALCAYESKVKNDLKRHSLIHQEATIKCDQCDFRTKHKNSLQSHMQLHASDKTAMVKCDKCEYSTWRKDRLNQHKMIHEELGQIIAYKRAMYECKLCDYQVKTSISIKNHMIKVHMDSSEVPTFKCPLCPYTSILERCLSRHITERHKDQPRMALQL